jgi:hypothetical protein
LNPFAKLDFTRNEFGAFEDRREAHIRQKMNYLIARRANHRGAHATNTRARRSRDRSGEDDQSSQDTAIVSAMVNWAEAKYTNILLARLGQTYRP